MVKAWMKSPTHRKNILTRVFKKIGIGITPGAPVELDAADTATYTTHFGRRR